jgi:hypothetical protein
MVSHIIVETHGAAAEAQVIQTLNRAGWSWRRYRNLLYCSAPEAATGGASIRFN